MDREQITDPEANADPAPVDRVVMQILECGFEHVEHATDGEMIVNSQWMRPTWVTINAGNRQQMESMIGAASVDRLVDGATVVVCNWSSYRKPDAV